MFSNRTIRTFVLGGTAAIALTAGIVGTSLLVQPVAAQSVDQTPDITRPEGTAVRGQRGLDAGKLNRGEHLGLLADELGVSEEALQSAYAAVRELGRDETTDPQQALADQLGVTVDELTAAMEAVRDAQQAAALADGTITQAQIDRMEAQQALKGAIDSDGLLAEALGITTDELAAAKEAGIRLPELVEASGLTQDEFAEALAGARAAAVAQAVSDGVITQAQADALAAEDGSRLGGPGGHDGGRRGPGGQNRPGRGEQGQLETAPSSTTVAPNL